MAPLQESQQWTAPFIKGRAVGVCFSKPAEEVLLLDQFENEQKLLSVLKGCLNCCIFMAKCTMTTLHCSRRHQSLDEEKSRSCKSAADLEGI